MDHRTSRHSEPIDEAHPAARQGHIAPASLARYPVADPITQQDTPDTNGSTGSHIPPVVAIAPHPIDGRESGNSISCHTDPRRHMAKLLI